MTITYITDNPISATEQLDMVAPECDAPMCDLEIIGESDEPDFAFERADDGCFDIFVTTTSLTPSMIKVILAEINKCPLKDIILREPTAEGSWLTH